MSYSGLILADSPFAYWRFGEPSGTAADNAEGTADYDGTYVNTPTLGATGAVGGGDTAVTFSAASSESVTTGSLGTLASNIASSGNGGATVCLWYKSSSATTAYLLDADYSGGSEQLRCWIQSSGTRLSINVSSASAALQYSAYLASSISDGSWHFIAMQIDTSGIAGRIFLDGRWLLAIDQNGSTNYSPANEFDRAKINGIAGGSGEADCSIDELAVFDRFVESGQIENYYQHVRGVVGSGPHHWLRSPVMHPEAIQSNIGLPWSHNDSQHRNLMVAMLPFDGVASAQGLSVARVAAQHYRRRRCA